MIFRDKILRLYQQTGIWFLLSTFFILFSCQNLPKKNSQQIIPPNSGQLSPSETNQSQPRPPSSYQPSSAQQLTTEGESWNGSFSPDGRKIIFLSEKRIGHSQSQVYELSLSLSRQRRVTFHDGDNASPRFDSSGKYILYASTTDEIKEDPVFIQKSLSELSSPHSTKTVESSLASRSFIPLFNAPLEIYRSTNFGNQIERLTTSKKYDSEGSYHPSHPSILFTSLRSGQAKLHLMSIDGKSVRTLSKQNFIEAEGQFHPSGHRIVFVRYAPDMKSSQLISLDIQKGEEFALTEGAGVHLSPMWHPDGQKIVFSSNAEDENNFELYSINGDGSCRQRLTYSLGDDSLPAFSPDGKSIVFSSTRTGTKQLYLMDFRPPSTCPTSGQ